MNPSATLKLNGLSFPELFNPTGLAQLDQRFQARIVDTDETLGSRLQAYRNGAIASGLQVSELLLALAPHLEEFISDLFGIEQEVTQRSSPRWHMTPSWPSKNNLWRVGRVAIGASFRIAWTN